MSYTQVHHNHNHKREYIDMHNNGNQLLEYKFNKKLKLDHNEKYKQNLIKFEKLSTLLEGSHRNIFDMTTKPFNQNGLIEFENIKFYHNVLKNENSLTNGVRLGNISRRIMGKNNLKTMKRDGIKGFYELTYKKKLEQVNKLIKKDVPKEINKSEMTTEPKKSLFSNVTTVRQGKENGIHKNNSLFNMNTKNKPANIINKGYQDDDYSDVESDNSGSSSSFSSDGSSSDLSLTSGSEVHGYNEEYWKEHNKAEKKKKLFNDYNYLETMTDNENNDYEEYYHKKWDTLLEKNDDLMNKNHLGVKKRIDTFDDDKDSVFDLMKKETRNSISMAPKTAHTLLPTAFHTHMFLGNNTFTNIDANGNQNDLSIEEEDLNFFSEKGGKGSK
ncbi:hypothetical protein ACO0R3_004182 [Hanseniaspora guilliermondii]